MNSSAWDAVIFDYGGVLCFPPTQEDVEDYARSSGLDHESFYRLYAETRDYYGRSADGYSEHWKQVAAAAGFEVSEEALQDFITKESGLWTRPNEETLALAREVRASGHKIAILSNMTFDLLGVLHSKLGWLDEFSVKLWSCEHGCAKPDESIYLSCLEMLACQPSRALFFDDRERNVEAARRLGIDAHVFETAAQARAVFEKGLGQDSAEPRD
jgi:putative hydrolase of the HAD superfamily